MDTYEQAIAFLFGRINYERAPAGSYTSGDMKLDRVCRLLSLLGDPHERIPAVHVAGTKGKGSTAVMIAEIAVAAGYRVGLFTSPHISRFEERMQVNGTPPTPEELAELTGRVIEPVTRMDRLPGAMAPTYFEIATAMAWLHFVTQKVDIAVMEVGLGGRLDATNVCRPDVTVITNISHDHTAVLGNSIAAIAGEKAGIIKRAVPVISGAVHPEAREVIARVCGERGAPLFELGQEFQCRVDGRMPSRSTRPNGPFSMVDVETPRCRRPGIPVPLPGRHQAHNAALAIAALDALADKGWDIPVEAVYHGLQRVRCPLRIEVIHQQPTVIVDAAHNGASAEALLETLESTFPAQRRTLVFAASQDKDVSGLAHRLFPAFDNVILTQYRTNPRSVPIKNLVELVPNDLEHRIQTAADPASAWQRVSQKLGPDDLLCVTGSFFIAAEMREIILGGAAPDCVSEINGSPVRFAV